jgi:hypothetical protein
MALRCKSACCAGCGAGVLEVLPRRRALPSDAASRGPMRKMPSLACAAPAGRAATPPRVLHRTRRGGSASRPEHHALSRPIGSSCRGPLGIHRAGCLGGCLAAAPSAIRSIRYNRLLAAHGAASSPMGRTCSTHRWPRRHGDCSMPLVQRQASRTGGGQVPRVCEGFQQVTRDVS